MNKLLLLMLCAASAHAVIIPTDRRVAWQNNVGVYGGIPDSSLRTTYTNVAAGTSRAGVQTALNNCPSNQVVQLAAGNYTGWTSDLDWSTVKAGVILKGAGQGITYISQDSGHWILRGPSTYDLAQFNSVQALSVQPAAGDTTVTVATHQSWMKTNELYIIHQLVDTNFVSLEGIEDHDIASSECRWCQTLGENRTAGQEVKIIGTNGTGPVTLTLERPLLYGWSTGLAAEITPAAYPATSGHGRGWGIENLTFETTYTASQVTMLTMSCVEGCWLKNVTFTNSPGGAHCLAYFSYGCSIVDSRFEDSHLLLSGQGYGNALNYGSSYFLVQNNIYRNLHIHMSSSYGGGGHVFAYNLCVGSGNDGNQYVGIGTHGSHTMMNLWEGNYSQDKAFLDFIHGSSSHQTFLRNRIFGTHPTEGLGLAYAIGNDKYNRTNNFVGNIMGVTNTMTGKEQYWSVGSPNGNDRVTWTMGYYSSSQLSNTNLADSSNTLSVLRHGNVTIWSTTNALNWDANIADQSIPSSYYLSTAPTWFGNLPWPPFDPQTRLGTNATDYTFIPAGWLYAYGTNPPAAGSQVEHKALRQQSRSRGSLRR